MRDMDNASGIIIGNSLAMEKVFTTVSKVAGTDADVLLHALCDAILGAAGLGDIGQHFPDRDPAYKGISSLELLDQVMKKVSGEGFVLGNADLIFLAGARLNWTVIAQEPKLAGYFEKMRENICRCTGTEPASINIKATTTEHLGYIGRGEGIAAQAVVSMVRSDRAGSKIPY